MAVKGASAKSLGGLVDVASDGGDDGRSKGDVGDKVTVPISTVSTPSRMVTESPAMEAHLHDVDVQPVGALLHGASTVMAERSKVSRQDGGRDDGLGSHC